MDIPVWALRVEVRVSHISRRTSEIWGTLLFAAGKFDEEPGLRLMLRYGLEMSKAGVLSPAFGGDAVV
jgi:hypothetical protein